jgi:hypothetical protein
MSAKLVSHFEVKAQIESDIWCSHGGEDVGPLGSSAVWTKGQMLKFHRNDPKDGNNMFL